MRNRILFKGIFERLPLCARPPRDPFIAEGVRNGLAYGVLVVFGEVLSFSFENLVKEGQLPPEANILELFILYLGLAAPVLLVTALGGAIMALIALLFPRLQDFFDWTRRGLLQESSLTERFSRPLFILSLFGGVLIFFSSIIISRRYDPDAIPWVYALVPWGASVFWSITLPAKGKQSRPAALVRRQVILGLFVTLVGSAFAALAETKIELEIAQSHDGSPRVFKKLAQAVTDWDQDGAIRLYGGHDCAPFNPDIHPLAIEVPRNGIDEDCSGADWTAEQPPLEKVAGQFVSHKGLIKRPHILLITTDALSIAHTGLGRDRAKTTPQLDEWANTATLFTQAYSYGPDTRTTLPALLTGYPTETVVGFRSDEKNIPQAIVLEHAPRLADTLQQLGYRTVALLPRPSFFAEENWPGLTHGFQKVSFEAYRQSSRSTGHPKKVHSAEALTNQAIEEINQADGPLFLWVHYYDHHGP
ncbi:MAG: sulfatase-like hydrolase/transferase, partial [Polyangiaceae bacterium]|nr:sulfatase-like hydrolase/transferase [Polyangiaceae bacterium]